VMNIGEPGIITVKLFMLLPIL
jgi:hypothetical protein